MESIAVKSIGKLSGTRISLMFHFWKNIYFGTEKKEKPLFKVIRASSSASMAAGMQGRCNFYQELWAKNSDIFNLKWFPKNGNLKKHESYFTAWELSNAFYRFQKFEFYQELWAKKQQNSTFSKSFIIQKQYEESFWKFNTLIL